MAPHPTSNWQTKIPKVDSKPVDNGKVEHNYKSMWTHVRDQTPRMAITDANCIDPHIESKNFGASNADILQIKDNLPCCDSGEFLSLELSLKRLRGVGDSGNSANDDCNILRHSDLSAFSKYNTASSANQGPTGNVGSCSPLDNSSVAMKTENTNNIPFHLSGTIVNQQSNGSSNNNDKASTAKKVNRKPEAFNNKSESTSVFKSFHSSAFQPVQNGHSSPQQVIPARAEDTGVKAVYTRCRGNLQQIQSPALPSPLPPPCPQHKATSIS